MTIEPLHQVINYKDKHTLVKGLIYLKLLEKGIYLPANDLNVLALFAIYSDIPEVVEETLKRKFFKSEDTVNNSISKLVKMDLLKKRKGDRIREIDSEIFPGTSSDTIAATYKIHNIQTN